MSHIRVAGVFAALLIQSCAPLPPTAATGAGLLTRQFNGGLNSQTDPGNGANDQRFGTLTLERFWGNGQQDNSRAAVGAGQTTRLRIEALSEADLFYPASLDQYGAVVARMFNLGNRIDAVYGTVPGPFVYYFVVRKDPADATQVIWQLYQVNLESNRAIPTPVARGRVTKCHTTGPVHGLGEAGFRSAAECLDSGHSGGGPGRMFVLEAGTVSRAAQSRDPGWFTCEANGCCTFDSAASR